MHPSTFGLGGNRPGGSTANSLALHKVWARKGRAFDNHILSNPQGSHLESPGPSAHPGTCANTPWGGRDARQLEVSTADSCSTFG